MNDKKLEQILKDKLNELEESGHKHHYDPYDHWLEFLKELGLVNQLVFMNEWNGDELSKGQKCINAIANTVNRANRPLYIIKSPDKDNKVHEVLIFDRVILEQKLSEL